MLINCLADHVVRSEKTGRRGRYRQALTKHISVALYRPLRLVKTF
jgi:hypothetical protein